MVKWRKMLISWLALIALACTFGQGLPSPSPSPTPSTPPLTPEAEVVLAPTMTPAPPVSGGGCTLNAAYVADVTIPDNTVLQPGTAFTKVWRLRNSGTCDWEPGTQLIFVSGEPMTAIGAVPVPAVVAGATTDISVEMTAPTAPGTYKSVWQLQSPSGKRFGSQVYVQIVVPAPPTATPPPTATSLPTDTPSPTATPFPIIILPTVGWGGGLNLQTASFDPVRLDQVDGNGEMWSGSANAGDRKTNVGLEAFLTFDVSDIPDNAAIVNIWLEFPSYDTLGQPFEGTLGCLAVFEQDYGQIDPGDYVHLPVSGAQQRYCSLSDIANADSRYFSNTDGLTARLVGNSYQLRLQFDGHETDGDGVADTFRSMPRLFVSYIP